MNWYKKSNFPSDADYLQAINDGQNETIVSLITQSARSSGYTVGPLYHGTDKSFTSFTPSASGEYGPGVYLSFSSEGAHFWGGINSKEDITAMPLYAKMANPFRVSKLDLHEMALEPEDPNEVDGEPIGLREVHRRLRLDGHDGIIGTGLTDSDIQIIIFDPSRIKSSSPITRDDAGNIIPLSKRFDSNVNDIRY
jgi:hypothetical protein